MTKDELLKLEHATLLEEFKTAKENILFEVGQSRQVVNITLTVASILVVGVPFIIQSNLPILFLIAPLIFYPLAWSQIRYLNISSILIQYLMTVLVPRIQAVLKELSPYKDRNFDSIMSWDTYLETADRRHILILLPLAAGNYGINILAAAFSICAYFAAIYGKQKSIPIIDLIFIVVNAFLFLYSVGLGFWAKFFSGTGQMSDVIQKRRLRSK